jgi:hypothetical protein
MTLGVESELEINDNAYDKTDPMLHIDHDPSLSSKIVTFSYNF